MSYVLSASVFDDMEALENVNVQELNFMGIPTSGTKTGDGGDFVLIVSSPEAKVRVSHIGYKTVTLTARDFADKSYINLELDDEQLNDVVINLPAKDTDKKDNTLLYVLGAALAATVIYAATRGKAKPVKI
jgi:hypothetical protein